MRIETNEIIATVKQEVQNKKTRSEFMLHDILKHVVLNLNDNREFGKEFTTKYSCHHKLSKDHEITHTSYSAMYNSLVEKKVKIDDETLNKLGLATLKFNGVTFNYNSSSFTVCISYTLYSKED